MARYEITSADGRKRIVDGDSGEILPDGATLRVPMMFRDAALTPVQKAIADAATHFDAAGGGGRPGFAFDYAAAARVKEQAYQDAKAEMSDAWKTPAVTDGRRRHKVVSRDPQGRETGSAEWEEEDAAPPSAPAMTADEGRRLKDEAYAAMCQDLRDGWRTRP